MKDPLIVCGNFLKRLNKKELRLFQKTKTWFSFLENGISHHIATVSNIPDLVREKLTLTSSDGEPVLNPKFLYQVLSIDGMSVSPKTKRLTHAVVKDWSFRTDKTPNECVMTTEELDSHIL